MTDLCCLHSPWANPAAARSILRTARIASGGRGGAREGREPARSPKSVGKDRSVLRVLWRLQTFLCVRGVSAIVHIYTSVLQAPAAAGPNGAPAGGIARVSGRAMQDLGYELPRIPIPRTWVNKVMNKGRGCYCALALFLVRLGSTG